MIDECLPMVSIKRSLGYFCWVSALRVFIDGQSIARLYGKSAVQFSVMPGEHLLTVTLAHRYSTGLLIKLREGDRVEFICTTNAVQLHPWHMHAFWFALLFCGVLHPLGIFIPPIRALLDKMIIIEMPVVMGMGLIGMMIYLWRVHKAGIWHPALYLTSVELPPKEQSEEEQS